MHLRMKRSRAYVFILVLSFDEEPERKETLVGTSG